MEARARANRQTMSVENSLRDIPRGWDESLDKVDDDGEGEPYMEWLSMSLASDLQ